MATNPSADQLVGILRDTVVALVRRDGPDLSAMEPRVLDYIPPGVPFGFDDLIHTLLARGLPAYTFAHDGLWLDIGRIEDFQTAQELAWDDQLPAFEVVAAA